MNRIEGVVEDRVGTQGVCLVGVRVPAGRIEALVLTEAPADLWPGRQTEVVVSFKESDVLLGPEGSFRWTGVIPARVCGWEAGEILTRVDLESAGTRWSALCPSSRLEALGIRTGSLVDTWVPPHEVVLEGLPR